MFSTHYTFFDRTVIDPVWRLPWTEFFQKYPASRKQIGEIIANNINDRKVNTEGDYLAQIFQSKTVAWTVRHSSPQFFVIGEFIWLTPSLKKHSVTLSTDNNESCFALLAAGINAWVRGALSKQSLRTIVKLHNFVGRQVWLDLPRRLAAEVRKLVSPKEMISPLYRWQGPGPGLYNTTGWTDYELHNCLREPDTRRFLAFVERAWEEDWVVPFVKPRDAVNLFSPPTKLNPTFKQVELAQNLMKILPKLRKLKRPSVFRYIT